MSCRPELENVSPVRVKLRKGVEIEPIGRLDDFEAGGAVLRPADLQNRRTHEADHNSRALADLLQGFRAARRRLVDRLTAYGQDAWARTALHPRLQQPMRLVDHVFFVVEHDAHHLAAIDRLLTRR